ncbi:MAG: hypothetical protein M1834_001427 [Cirrosporium novae-zelandiae]|nr:MAG: hypothetical protein M1834_001427 [Cirrosporium novae-zelandiae]
MTAAEDFDSPHGAQDTYLIIAIVLTLLVAFAAFLYVSGAGEDLFNYCAKYYLKVKAKAQQEALEHAGEEKTRGYLKSQLKGNPLVGEDEVEEIDMHTAKKVL